MMPAAKALDPLLGIDIHIMQPPGPVPPVPLPNPYIGMVFDPMDFVPFLGATTRIAGLPRAQAGTAGQALPPHLPIGGVFVKPPSNESEIFMGSAIVSIDGDAASYMALPVLSCVDVGMPAIPRLKKKKKTVSLVLPLTKVLAIPSPVFIGGPPTISLTAMAGRAGLGNLLLLKSFIESGCDPMILVGLVAGKILGKLQHLASGALGKLANKLFAKAKGKFKGKARPPHGTNGHPHGNGSSCVNGTPIDSVTGEYYENYLDAKAGGDALFSWGRRYSSALYREHGPLGFGFRHSYMAKLELFAQAYRFETYQRHVHFFTPVSDVGDVAKSDGYVMTREAHDRITIARRGEPTLHFALSRDQPPRLVLVSRGNRRLVLEYDRDQLVGMQEGVVSSGVARLSARYLLQYYPNGLLYAVYRIEDPASGASSAGYTSLARYEYDQQGRIQRATNALGGVHTLHYDVEGRVASMTDPRGYSFFWRYDTQGRCVESTGQDGLWSVKLQYFPGETHIQECNPGTFIHKFNSAGTLVEVHDPYGGVRKRELDPQTGKVVRETDSGGRVTEWLYDEDGYHYARRNQYGRLVPPEDVLGELPDPKAPVLPRSAAEREWAVEPDARAAFGPSAKLLHGVALETARALVSSSSQPAQPQAYLPERRYNDRGDLIEEIQPSGRRRTWEYDQSGNVLRARDADGRVTQREITRWNLLGARSDPLGNTVRYQYTDNEKVAVTTDQLGNVTSYEYDEKDRIVRVKRGSLVEEEYVYDAGDRLVEKRDANGQVLLRFEHDKRSLVKHVILADGSEHFVAHDDSGKTIAASTDKHEVVLQRDAFGRLVSDTVDGLGIEVSHGGSSLLLFGKFRCDRASCSRLTSQSGSTELVVWTDPTGRMHSVATDPTGLVRRETSAGTLELARFDDEGQIDVRVVERRDGSARARPWIRRYSRSAEGDLLAVDDSEQGRTEYQVDDAHRLIGERGPSGAHRFQLDPAGNPQEKPGLSGVAIGPHNTLLQANGLRFTHDTRTHIAQSFDPSTRQITRYTYDARDMLVRIEVGRFEGERWIDELAPWTAEYDAIGRRLSSGRAGQQRKYYWRDRQLVAEVAESGALRIYCYAHERSWVPLFFVDYGSLEDEQGSGRVYSLFVDHQGMPVAVENAAGAVVWRTRRVDPYGKLDVDPSSQIELNLRWPGHYYDPETGLHCNGFRYYDPTLGRYLQADPIGQAGGVNVYAYASNPLRDVDLLGLHPDPKNGRHSNDGGDDHPSKKRPDDEKNNIKREQLDSGLTRVESDAPPTARLSNGQPMPEGTRKVQHFDENGKCVGTHYVDPANNNRTIRSEVPIDSPASRKKESTRPTPVGMESGDHRGHNAPERHAADQRAANVPENIAPQAPESNLGPKKRHENDLPQIQRDNHPSEVTHVTEHEYPPKGKYPEGDPRNSRPTSSSHGVEIDGQRNPDHDTGPIPNDSSASDTVLLSEQ
jgi:RHS repeat-associated protein